MASRIDIFYAYPSEPPSLGETISQAIKELSTTADFKAHKIRIKPWTDMSITGKRILREITESIDRARIFACDLTYDNLNVAFELGYSVGSLKRVWISLNTSLESAKTDYKRVYGGILPAGYADYVNHQQLAAHLMADHPWTSLNDHLLSNAYKAQAPRSERPTLLYVRPQIETDAVIATIETLRSSFFAEGLLIDDPNEDPSPSLEWYADKVHNVDAVLVHLLATNHRDALRYNVKASFVAGLAHAFRKQLRMLAHTPFESPIDYHHLLSTHDTCEKARLVLAQWLTALEPALPRRRPRRSDEDRQRVAKLDLRFVTVGEHVAENESDTLDGYFSETSTYYEALESQTAILLGRRGTGKTANLFALQTKFSTDRRNLVCVIKPPGYEVDGLVRLFQESMQFAERGYLIESLWKFLIFSELACTVADDISRRPKYQTPSAPEAEFLDYMEPKRPTLCAPFSQRLDSAVRSLIGIGDQEPEAQRTRISEQLHVRVLHNLRELLGPV